MYLIIDNASHQIDENKSKSKKKNTTLDLSAINDAVEMLENDRKAEAEKKKAERKEAKRKAEEKAKTKKTSGGCGCGW